MAGSLMSVLIAGVLVFAQPPANATATIVEAYLEIHSVLASDRVDGVKGHARTIAAQARALGKEGADLATAAAAVESAADVKAARDAFGPLSEAVIARVKADPAFEAGSKLRLAYCSMADASWLQRGEQIRNPYYGSQMLTCGELRPLTN